MKEIKSFFSILLVLLLLSACSPTKDQENVIRVGVSPDYPPFEYVESGQLKGFDIDLIKEIAKKLGKDIDFHEMSFANLKVALKARKIDIAASAMSPVYDPDIDFSKGYFKALLSIVTLESNDQNSLDTLENFDSKRTVVWGVQLGTTMEKWLRNLVDARDSNIEIFTLDSTDLLVESLKSGRIDYIVLEQPQAKEFSRLNKELKYFGVSENLLRDAALDEYSIAIRKELNMKRDIDLIISDLQEKGFLKDLTKKWLGISDIDNLKGDVLVKKYDIDSEDS